MVLRRAAPELVSLLRRENSHFTPRGAVQTGEIATGAGFKANKFSPAPMLLFEPNSAPNLGRIPLCLLKTLKKA